MVLMLKAEKLCPQSSWVMALTFACGQGRGGGDTLQRHLGERCHKRPRRALIALKEGCLELTSTVAGYP